LKKSQLVNIYVKINELKEVAKVASTNAFKT